jgi:imidazoleglycerol-phosphate dehydratase/histidinol-phosphatase
VKRVLFIDRDGTLIKEPETDFQVDSLEKLEFMPGVFKAMNAICTLLDFEIAMVTNQDGMGTKLFPENTFWRVQKKMVTAFENEGIQFDEIFIDTSMPEDNAPTRKPGTAMLTKYLTDEYDLENSFVIGDRLTDVELAKNLGAKGILYKPFNSAEEIDQSGLSNLLACKPTIGMKYLIS